MAAKKSIHPYKVIVMCSVRYKDFCIQQSICRLSEEMVYIPENVTYSSWY